MKNMLNKIKSLFQNKTTLEIERLKKDYYIKCKEDKELFELNQDCL